MKYYLTFSFISNVLLSIYIIQEKVVESHTLETNIFIERAYNKKGERGPITSLLVTKGCQDNHYLSVHGLILWSEVVNRTAVMRIHNGKRSVCIRRKGCFKVINEL